ncbi:MAG TPA: SRPBCC family protein [Dehalococcoidia bacterium]|nr:SRPBCC family protein [Dehalococcoidia bacterium]
MARSKRLIRVNPEQAFAYLSDLTRHPEWSADSLRLEQATPGELGPGSRYLSHGRQFGQALDDEVEIIAVEPNARFEFEARGRGGVFRHAFYFECGDGGTLVTKEMRPLKIIFPFGVLRPITEWFLARRMAKDLERIAGKLEARDV